jgi:hypothetical protein
MFFMSFNSIICGREKGMKMRFATALAITIVYCGSLSATLTAPTTAKKLQGRSIDMFNAKALTIEGRENLKYLIDIATQVQLTLDNGLLNKKTYSPTEVKARTTKVVTPLKGYFQALFPGRKISQDILKLSILAHDPSGRELPLNYLLQFFQKNDLVSMNNFFQKTITDHTKLMRICREFVTLANDIKASLSPAAKQFYRLKYGTL